MFIRLMRFLSKRRIICGCTDSRDAELAIRMMTDVLESTGITATAGIGTNLYLSKIAMDIYAKHVPADENGMRIAELDEMSYRRLLWSHTPLTDFWRIGRGYASKLAKVGIHTMAILPAALSASQATFTTRTCFTNFSESMRSF